MAVTFHARGTEKYDRGTSPRNSSGTQQPAAVARPVNAGEVAEAVREAARRGLVVRPQATGHGAGGAVGADTLILDTSALTSLHLDPDTGVATAGAGITWGELNPQAERHGRLGLAGSSPSVSISGYTFGGGIGWLSRPHGTAAGALRRVEYVDGSGSIRTASDDAADELDRDAIFAFRGGGGVGIATSLEFDLVPVPDLHAGYLLWPVERLDAVVAAWAAAMGEVGDDVATSISVLHTPPGPPFPEHLRSSTVVHLAVAASQGADGSRAMLDAVRTAAAPEVDTWAPADAATLAQIHLDPPAATPALGDAAWLTGDAPDHARDILAGAAADDSPVVMLEIRSVGNRAEARPGAHSAVGGPYLWHAVAPLRDPSAQPAIEDAFASIRTTAHPVDTRLSVGSWVEGATSVPDALPDDVRTRVASIADGVDPDGVLHRSRFLT